MKSKIPELPADMPVLPEHAAWIGGELIDLGGQDEAAVRQAKIDEQQQKIADWQAQTGFAKIAAQMESSRKAVVRTERRVATGETARKVAQVAIVPVERLAAPVGRYLGAVASNLKTEAKVTLFDLIEGTHSKEDLHHAQKVRRVTRHYASLGLLDDEPCAKHRKALKKAESLV